MPNKSNLWMLSMPSIAESLIPSRARRLSTLKVAKENFELEGGEGPGLISTPPSIRRILLMSEKKKSQERNMEFMDEG